ncbi:unnamed protein product [Alopecurus aequalis]
MEFSPKLATALLFALASAMIVTAWNTPPGHGRRTQRGARRGRRGAGVVGRHRGRVSAVVPGEAPRRLPACTLSGGPSVRRDPLPHTFDQLECGGRRHLLGVREAVLRVRHQHHIGCAAALCDGDVEVLIICSYSPPPMEGQTPY